MGIVDIKIDVMRESQWKKWSRSRIVQNPQKQQSHLSNSGAADVNSDLFMGHELYWEATKASPAEFTSIIERLGTNVSLCVSPLGNTVLHIAASHGNSSLVRQIAGLFPSLIFSRNSNGDTPLHLGAEAGQTAIVNELTSRLRESNGISGDMITKVKNEQGNTPLHKALISSNEEVAKTLVQVDPEAMFCLNNEEKSGLYLAAEAGYEDMINHTLNIYEEENQIYEIVKGKPPVHAAILGKHVGVLHILLKKEQRLVQSRDEEGRTPLHLAAIIGYLDGIAYLLKIYSLASVVRDNFGFFPVHWAAMQGRVNVVEILLKHSPDPVELLDSKCRNVLHIAAESGRKNVVIYILKKLDCKKLINARDQEGNTPLHLATMNWHPRIVSALTWNQNLNLALTNNDGLTALDAAEFYINGITSFQQRLTWTALNAAGTPRAPPMYNHNFPNQLSDSSKPVASINNYKDRVNTLLVVATLIATITFAAGFTVPGGYKNSNEPLQGQATLLHKQIFSLFIFCDTISMYSAMIVVVSMVWAQMGDLNLVVIALRLGLWLLGVSLTTMSIAFMAGIYATVSDLHWLAHGVTIMGTIFFVTLTCLSFPLCFPISSKRRYLRCISHYPFHLLMYVTKSGTSSNLEDKYSV
ncbi:hypothetical protein QQ045_005976 [Rhodiola kirilowii]